MYIIRTMLCESEKVILKRAKRHSFSGSSAFKSVMDYSCVVNLADPSYSTSIKFSSDILSVKNAISSFLFFIP